MSLLTYRATNLDMITTKSRFYKNLMNTGLFSFITYVADD